MEEAKRVPYDGTTPASERQVPPHVVVNGEVEGGEGQDRHDGEEGGAADCCDPGPHLRLDEGRGEGKGVSEGERVGEVWRV